MISIGLLASYMLLRLLRSPSSSLQVSEILELMSLITVCSTFFHWFYSGASHAYVFDRAALPRIAARAAHAAGLDIFGGDVIVAPTGDLTLIDLNDWPSFAPCRAAAADAIADYLARRAHAAWNPGLVSSANQSAL